MPRKFACVAALLSIALLSGVLHGQQAPDATKPPTDAWPTYHGDYKANHFSPVKQITTANARNLSIPCTDRTNCSPDRRHPRGRGSGSHTAAGRGRTRPRRVAAAAPARPCAAGPSRASRSWSTASSDLATTNNAYAVDARSGAEIRRFPTGSRAAGPAARAFPRRLGNTLFFQTGDEFVVAIDATTGKGALAQTGRVRSGLHQRHHAACREEDEN